MPLEYRNVVLSFYYKKARHTSQTMQHSFIVHWSGEKSLVESQPKYCQINYHKLRHSSLLLDTWQFLCLLLLVIRSTPSHSGAKAPCHVILVTCYLSPATCDIRVPQKNIISFTKSLPQCYFFKKGNFCFLDPHIDLLAHCILCTRKYTQLPSLRFLCWLLWRWVYLR